MTPPRAWWFANWFMVLQPLRSCISVIVTPGSGFQRRYSAHILYETQCAYVLQTAAFLKLQLQVDFTWRAVICSCTIGNRVNGNLWLHHHRLVRIMSYQHSFRNAISGSAIHIVARTLGSARTISHKHSTPCIQALVLSKFCATNSPSPSLCTPAPP